MFAARGHPFSPCAGPALGAHSRCYYPHPWSLARPCGVHGPAPRALRKLDCTPCLCKATLPQRSPAKCCSLGAPDAPRQGRADPTELEKYRKAVGSSCRARNRKTVKEQQCCLPHIKVITTVTKIFDNMSYALFMQLLPRQKLAPRSRQAGDPPDVALCTNPVSVWRFTQISSSLHSTEVHKNRGKTVPRKGRTSASRYSIRRHTP